MTRRAALLLALALATPAAAADLGAGQALYEQHCAKCHGLDGRPLLPQTPDFSRGEGLFQSEQRIVDAIRYGVRTMPGFGGQIEKREILDVVFYLRTLQR